MHKLYTFRKQIDIIDEEIIKLLGQRFGIVEQVGKHKRQHNINILQSNRWEEVLTSRTIFAKKYNISSHCIETIWNAIHETALEKEKNI